jgi:hypothetical protein
MRWMGPLAFSIVLVACGARTELYDKPPRSPLCGNGVLDPGEECDLGPANSDSAKTFAVTQNGQTFRVQPLVGDRSATEFYDYIGASSHSGLEVEGESRLYLYRDATTSALSLVINHNIFHESNGSATMDVSGLPPGFTIEWSDDRGELLATGATTALGTWEWDHNTDGGMIGSLCNDGSWTIVASAKFIEGISSWVWVDGDASRKPLDMKQPVTITPVTQCNTYCTRTAWCG